MIYLNNFGTGQVNMNTAYYILQHPVNTNCNTALMSAHHTRVATLDSLNVTLASLNY